MVMEWDESQKYTVKSGTRNYTMGQQEKIQNT